MIPCPRMNNLNNLKSLRSLNLSLKVRMKVRRVYLYYWTGVDGLFINSYFRDYCVVCLCDGVEGLCTSCVHDFAMFTSMLTFILYHTQQLKTLKHR